MGPKVHAAFRFALVSSAAVPVLMWLDDQSFVVGSVRTAATGRGLQVSPLVICTLISALNVALGKFYQLAAWVAVPLYGVLGAGLVGVSLVRGGVLPLLMGLLLWSVAGLAATHRHAFG